MMVMAAAVVPQQGYYQSGTGIGVGRTGEQDREEAGEMSGRDEDGGPRYQQQQEKGEERGDGDQDRGGSVSLGKPTNTSSSGGGSGSEEVGKEGHKFSKARQARSSSGMSGSGSGSVTGIRRHKSQNGDNPIRTDRAANDNEGHQAQKEISRDEMKEDIVIQSEQQGNLDKQRRHHHKKQSSKRLDKMAQSERTSMSRRRVSVEEMEPNPGNNHGHGKQDKKEESKLADKASKKDTEKKRRSSNTSKRVDIMAQSERTSLSRHRLSGEEKQDEIEEPATIVVIEDRKMAKSERTSFSRPWADESGEAKQSGHSGSGDEQDHNTKRGDKKMAKSERTSFSRRRLSGDDKEPTVKEEENASNTKGDKQMAKSERTSVSRQRGRGDETSAVEEDPRQTFKDMRRTSSRRRHPSGESFASRTSARSVSASKSRSKSPKKALTSIMVAKNTNNIDNNMVGKSEHDDVNLGTPDAFLHQVTQRMGQSSNNSNNNNSGEGNISPTATGDEPEQPKKKHSSVTKVQDHHKDDSRSVLQVGTKEPSSLIRKSSSKRHPKGTKMTDASEQAHRVLAHVSDRELQTSAAPAAAGTTAVVVATDEHKQHTNNKSMADASERYSLRDVSDRRKQLMGETSAGGGSTSDRKSARHIHRKLSKKGNLERVPSTGSGSSNKRTAEPQARHDKQDKATISELLVENTEQLEKEDPISTVNDAHQEMKTEKESDIKTGRGDGNNGHEMNRTSVENVQNLDDNQFDVELSGDKQLKQEKEASVSHHGRLPDFEPDELLFDHLDFPEDSQGDLSFDALVADCSPKADTEMEADAEKKPCGARESAKQHKQQQERAGRPEEFEKKKPSLDTDNDPTTTYWICLNCKEEHDESQLYFCGMCGASRPKVTPKTKRSLRKAPSKVEGLSPKSQSSSKARSSERSLLRPSSSAGGERRSKSSDRIKTTPRSRAKAKVRPLVSDDETDDVLIVKCLDGGAAKAIDMDLLNQQFDTFDAPKVKKPDPKTPTRARKSTIRRAKSDMTGAVGPSPNINSAPQTPQSSTKKAPVQRSKSFDARAGEVPTPVARKPAVRKAIPRRAKSSSTEYLQQLKQQDLLKETGSDQGDGDVEAQSAHTTGDLRPNLAGSLSRPSILKTASSRLLGGFKSPARVATAMSIGSMPTMSAPGLFSSKPKGGALLLNADDDDDDDDDDEFANDLGFESLQKKSSDKKEPDQDLGMLRDFPGFDSNLAKSPVRSLPSSESKGCGSSGDGSKVKSLWTKWKSATKKVSARDIYDNDIDEGDQEDEDSQSNYLDVDIDLDEDLPETELPDSTLTPRKRAAQRPVRKRPGPISVSEHVTPGRMNARNRIRRASISNVQTVPDLDVGRETSIHATPARSSRVVRRGSLTNMQNPPDLDAERNASIYATPGRAHSRNRVRRASLTNMQNTPDLDVGKDRNDDGSRRRVRRASLANMQGPPDPDIRRNESIYATPGRADARNRVVRRGTLTNMQPIHPHFDSVGDRSDDESRRRVRRASLGYAQEPELHNNSHRYNRSSPAHEDANRGDLCYGDSGGHQGQLRTPGPRRRRRLSVGDNNPILQRTIANIPQDPIHAVRRDLLDEWERHKQLNEGKMIASSMKQRYQQGISMTDAAGQDIGYNGIVPDDESEDSRAVDLELDESDQEAVSDISSQDEFN